MCDCITLINDALAEHNGRLDVALAMNFDNPGRPEFLPMRAQISYSKVDTKKRKPLPALPATYCPFCGDRYTWPDPAKLTDGQLRAELERAARQHPLLEEKHREFRYESWERSGPKEET